MQEINGNKIHAERSLAKALREGKSKAQWKYEWACRHYAFKDKGVKHVFKPYKVNQT